MGTLRTINHPGVEIREYDISQYTPLVGGTTSLITGFASKGEDCVPLEITSKNAFLNYFGVPDNEAERYFYYAANEIFSQAGRCIAAKIPYDNLSKDIYYQNTYSVAASSALSTAFTPSTAYNANDFVNYDGVHKIVNTNLTTIATSTVDGYRTGVGEPSTGTFSIIDKSRAVLKANILSKSSPANEVIGYFPVVTTALNALPLQNMLTMSRFNNDNSTSWMSVSSISTTATLVESNNLALSLATSSIYDNSLSKSIALQFPSIVYDENGYLDNEFMDKILVSVVMMKNDPNENNKISFSVVESFLGSLDKASKNIDGQSNYIGNIVNNNSQYIEFYGTLASTSIAGTGAIYKVDTQDAGIYGFTSAQTAKTIKTSTILSSLDTIHDRISNIDENELDLVVDAGVSNITQYIGDVYSYNNSNYTVTTTTTASASTWQVATTPVLSSYNIYTGISSITSGNTSLSSVPVCSPGYMLGTTTSVPVITLNVQSGGIYDPDGITSPAWTGTASDRTKTELWRTVISKYITFCSSTRKDCMTIVDGLRTLGLAGSQKIVRAGNSATIDIDILGNLKNLTGINSSYGAMYIDWFKYLDTFTGTNFWMPPSIVANGIYIYTDRTANYWDAPAGLNRGVVNGAVDIAFNPTGKQQDSIYSKSFNYAINYPYDGIIIEGQKTLQTKPSGFDRVNVRRLFLKMERFTYKTARYYVDEPNNVYTRTRLLDQLIPIYEQVKTAGGMTDYKLICDEKNNTSLTIDNNELRLAVLIKPTKTAEYLICDFYNLPTGLSFSEVSI